MSRFNALLLHETDKARLVKVVDRNIWIPRSVTTAITKIGLPDAKGQCECIIDIADWFADKNDL